MKEYRIIFSDIDGTLLTDDKQITEATKDKILNLEQQGIPFVLVSARPPFGVWPIQRMAGVSAPIIGYGGGIILDSDGTVLKSYGMEMGQALEIKNLAQAAFPDICCNTYSENRWIVDDKDSRWIRQEAEIIGSEPDAGDVVQLLGDQAPVHKFLFMGEADRIEELEKFLKTRYPEHSISRSWTYYLEVMNGEATKGNAVRTLCEEKGVSVRASVAFGDSHNDLSMLEAAGLGVAMGNAPEEVREKADMVTLDNEHEGLLAALNQIFLGKC